MAANRTPGSVEALYQQLACERAGRARATLAQQVSVERLFGIGSQGFEAALVAYWRSAGLIPVEPEKSRASSVSRTRRG